ncbi:MAG: (deoxy)nucleoside triphosphate pyrophosphohydrolase [Victivallaceae bacterium]
MKTIKVCAAVIAQENKILLTSRTEDYLAGFWEFPGGKQEADENPVECLIRELREELSAEILVFDTIFFIDHEYPDKKVHIRFMRCALRADSPLHPQEGQEYCWVKRNELNQINLLPADRPVADFLNGFKI